MAAQSPGTAAIPEWLRFAFAVGIVGGIGEALYRFNRNAGYWWVVLVLLAFAATGGRIEAIGTFLQTVGAIARG